tara:strand:- start:137 stop:955 length:819 start_codon:yes stop_codon:yes gene_type:complete
MKNEFKRTEEGSLSRLIKIVSQLRDPQNGCPWDLEQTHKSLIPYVLEEAHEVADAIREQNNDHLIEELGDLLLQVVLHAQIASEENSFNLDDVIQRISKKLVRRHPHVFRNQKLNTREEVNIQWEKIKSTESKTNNSSSPISDHLRKKSISQPAIAGSMVISKKVAKLGFEWKTANELWDKFYEEINELKEEIKNKNSIKAERELGDVLFTLINIGRWYQISPEEGLAGTNKKFLERFAYMESKLGADLSNQSIEELESFWKEAKKYLSQNS